jgi:hypothetical protein
MSVNKNHKKKDNNIELTGKVVVRKFAKGSKSEHDAVYIESDKGDFVLRRVGGNPFHDPKLHELKGKNVTARGVIDNYVFFAKEVKEKPDME